MHSDNDLDDPQGDILQGLGFALVLALAGIAVSLGTGYALSDSADAQITAHHEAEAQDRKALRPDQFSFPLDWTATVEQGGKVRYYVPQQRERNF